jgi:NAD(P)-dependent dehydrogenase (short-subunit alcohol dehydrogenase family)
MKIVLITGCSSGFGRSLVNAYLERGYRVIATLRNATDRLEIFSDIPESQRKLLDIQSLDVTKKEEIQAICEHIVQNYSEQLDVLVNNAGYGLYGALEDITEEQLRHQMEVNFFGPAFLTRGLLPFLRKSKGSVINISSLMARFSLPLGSAYSASKAALEGLSEGLYYELKKHGVNLSTIQPGGHRTQFAKSINWGEFSGSPDSPYTPETQAFKAMMNKLTSRPKAPDEREVVELALKMTEATSPPRRVLVGKDAVSTGMMQKILPERLYHAILCLFYSRVTKKFKQVSQ